MSGVPDAPVDPLLAALGYPAPDATQPALVELHAGAAFHRLALLLDTVEAYARNADLPAGEPAYLEGLRALSAGEPPRAVAERHYRDALRADERLAEAWFGLARLRQSAGAVDEAIDAFRRALALPAHPRAQPHAQLAANAHWHCATLLEDLGRGDEALAHYREAVSRCDSFGVHHVRYARFLRARGMVEESIPHFERMMGYSHRYFSEFVLPPLHAAPAAAPAPEALDTIHETADGAGVVFWNNLYWKLPAHMLPATAAQLAATQGGAPAAGWFKGLLGRLGLGSGRAPLRGAASIVEMEPGAPPG